MVRWTGRGFVLHTSDYFATDSTLLIDSGVCLTATIDILKAIASGGGPNRSILALGYAGWAAGQLESEIQGNGWLSCPADADLIFDPDIDNKYRRALAKLGIDLAPRQRRRPRLTARVSARCRQPLALPLDRRVERRASSLFSAEGDLSREAGEPRQTSAIAGGKVETDRARAERGLAGGGGRWRPARPPPVCWSLPEEAPATARRSALGSHGRSWFGEFAARAGGMREAVPPVPDLG